MAAAKHAVSSVLGTITSQPDVLYPKSGIVARDRTTFQVYKLQWDMTSESYMLEFDPRCIVRDVIEAASGPDAIAQATRWVEPDDALDLDFRNIPGIFQDAFVAFVTGLEVPPNPMSLAWAPSYGGEGTIWMVRRFPPPADHPGGLHWNAMPRDAVETFFRQRGW